MSPLGVSNLKHLSAVTPERQKQLSEAVALASCANAIGQLWSDVYLEGGMPIADYRALQMEMLRPLRK